MIDLVQNAARSNFQGVKGLFRDIESDFQVTYVSETNILFHVFLFLICG